MTYNPDEEIEQDRLSKLVGGLIIPEIIIKRFADSNIDDDVFFSKKGQASLIFSQLKNDLFEGINNYPFQNIGTFVDRQRQRVDDQAGILHNSVSNLLPGQFAIEARAKAGHQPTNEEKQRIITFNIYFSLRNNCEHLLNNILIKQFQAQTTTSSKLKAETLFNNLGDAAVDMKAESAIYDILIIAGLIDVDTKFVHSRDRIKGQFINILEDFFNKGYFKRKPSPTEYLNICNNTFKLNAKIGSIEARGKRIVQGSIDIPSFP